MGLQSPSLTGKSTPSAIDPKVARAMIPKKPRWSHTVWGAKARGLRDSPAGRNRWSEPLVDLELLEMPSNIVAIIIIIIIIILHELGIPFLARIFLWTFWVLKTTQIIPTYSKEIYTQYRFDGFGYEGYHIFMVATMPQISIVRMNRSLKIRTFAYSLYSPPTHCKSLHLI